MNAEKLMKESIPQLVNNVKNGRNRMKFRAKNGLDDRLRKLRSAFRTYQEFEDATGCNRMVMTRYINGEAEPLFTSIVRLCEGLNVDAQWLVMGDEDRKPGWV